VIIGNRDSHPPQWAAVEEAVAKAKQVLGTQADLLDEAAMKVLNALQFWDSPAESGFVQQRSNALAVLLSFRRVLVCQGFRDLHTDKLGPSGIALLVQIVRINEPGNVVVRAVDDQPKKCRIIVHWTIPSAKRC
jgi:hypothetical protein